MNACQVHEVKTISTHQSYHGWPTVARLISGKLLVVVSAGREGHVCPFGQVHLIRSTDNGATWTGPEILANGPLDDRDAGIMQTRGGTVLVNWFTSVAKLNALKKAESEGEEALRKFGSDGFIARCQKMQAALAPAVIRRELGVWMRRSDDGGRTWSEKYKVARGAGAPHGPMELSDGRLLFIGNWNARAMSGLAQDEARPLLGVSLSKDGGLTWRRIGEIPQRPGDPAGVYHEPHAVQAPDGRIVVHIRNHGDQDRWHVLQSESDDGGRTFGVPHTTGLVGLPAHLLALRDGRLLSTFGYRALPYGIRASISADGGRTWGEPMILDEKPVSHDLGYPSTVELADGSLFSVWYEKLPDQTFASVQAARWTLA